MKSHINLFMISLFLSQFLIQLICIFYCTKEDTKKKYKNKKIIIIGGTSGLGLSLALKLSNWNDVTITGRRQFNDKYLPVKFLKMDVQKIIKIDNNYDVIFYCAGYAVSKYFDHLDMNEIKDEFEVNYFGAVKVLKTIINERENKNNNNEFKCRDNRKLDFILIGSPLSFFTLPGYSAYSPTKSALFCLFSTIRPEMKLKNIEMYFYILSTTMTSGYLKENITKPKITMQIENIGSIASADERADTLLTGMLHNHIIYSDLLVFLMKINIDSWIVTVIHSLIIKFFYQFY